MCERRGEERGRGEERRGEERRGEERGRGEERRREERRGEERGRGCIKVRGYERCMYVPVCDILSSRNIRGTMV